MLKDKIKQILRPYFRLTANINQGINLENKCWDYWLQTKGLEGKRSLLGDFNDFEYRINPQSATISYHKAILDDLSHQFDISGGQLMNHFKFMLRMPIGLMTIKYLY
jgi:hypothetical protein